MQWNHHVILTIEISLAYPGHYPQIQSLVYHGYGFSNASWRWLENGVKTSNVDVSEVLLWTLNAVNAFFYINISFVSMKQMNFGYNIYWY